MLAPGFRTSHKVQEMLMVSVRIGRRIGIFGKDFLHCIRTQLEIMIHSSLGKHFVLFGFLLALWVANVFPVQRAEHVLQASAIVSSQRLMALQSLSREKLGDQSSVRWIRYTRSTKAVPRSRIESSVEHLHLEIGVRANAGLREIEQELERLTMPSNANETISNESKRVRAERWRLVAIDHQMERFRLDRQREENALAEAGLAKDEATDVAGKSKPAVTISFRKPLQDSGMITTAKASETNPLDSDRVGYSEKSWASKDQQTWQGLLTDRSQCLRCIESLEKQMLATQMHAAGTIALTGAPKYGVMSGRASVGNLLSVLAMGGFCALVLGTILRSPVVQRREKIRSTVDLGRGSLRSKCNTVSSSDRKQVERDLIATRMTQHNIPCLGTIEMCLNSPVISGASNDELQEFDAESVVHPSERSASLSVSKESIMARKRTFNAIAIEKINSWVLWSWVALFAFRFATDPNWRELLFNAPLAAFSSMVLGVY